jgi:hypothetical protein
MRWCTVSVTDPDGRRHSVDVQATSTFHAAHLFVVERSANGPAWNNGGALTKAAILDQLRNLHLTSVIQERILPNLIGYID